MTEPANQPDSQPVQPTDPQLAVWLREAVDDPSATAGQSADATRHLADVRRTLLDTLEVAGPVLAYPAEPSLSSAGRAAGLRSVWARHRLAVGGVAASIALAGALLLALHSGRQLSAMERMAKKLQEVKSYSYQNSGSNTHINKDGKRVTRQDDSTVQWLSPNAFHEETKIVRIVEDAGGGNRTEETLAHFEQVFPPGGSGVLVDHRHKTFDRIRYEMIGSKTYPWDTLRMIREGSYDVLADLGTRRIGDTEAHGYRLALKNAHDKENAVHDPVELWLDPETNLPIEFGWSGESEGWKYTDRTSDFRWNIALDSKRFEPVIPETYADITPPTEQSDLDQIVASLRLYAELSGGHYPRVKTFDPLAIRAEMLKMADSAAPADTEPVRQKKHQQIEQSMAGLNWIARILRIQYLSGYRGLIAGPADKDQVLFWWMASDNRFRVFYGDLRTEVLSDDQWSKLVPKEEIVGYYQNMRLERVAKKLFGVVSYSYRSAGTHTGINDDGKRETITDDWTVWWLAPDAYREEMKIVKTVEDVGGGHRTEKTLVHYETIFPAGKPGLYIDHRYKVFCWSPNEWGGSKTYPWEILRMIREGSYDVLADLGTKRIGETDVQGYRLALKNAPDDLHPLLDPVELWVDPETSLPVEFSWAGESEGWKYTDRATDFRWNIALDPKLFVPVIPEGYADTTPPTDKGDLDQVAAALRLYSQLSGGHYPPTKEFDPAAIRDEMLKMADAATAANSAAREQKHREIDQAKAGLNWIARILRNRLVSGYRGAKVGPVDKDQVLLWWTTVRDRYGVFFGDLRFEVLHLTEAQWSKLVPQDETAGEPQSK
ncbi:MAG TPA: hypothetical protein VHY91_18975 [Pirellulales bacterium]|jgi:outer membrane lipoprotein-sorting protein|nr:hypothetical protein [Pirellulales bacterium]